jgi:Protein of unknown function (DUF2905)
MKKSRRTSLRCTLLSAIASPVGSVVAFLSLEGAFFQHLGAKNVADTHPPRTHPGGGWSTMAVDRRAPARASARRYRCPHQNFTFYFPVATGLLISVVLTLILWLAGR